MSIFKMRVKSSENSLKIQILKDIPVTKILSLKAEAFKTTKNNINLSAFSNTRVSAYCYFQAKET